MIIMKKSNTVEWEINFFLPNFSEWGQVGTMKVTCIISVIRILTSNISFSE